MAKRYPKRKDILDSHRQVVERVRKADIAAVGQGSGGSMTALEAWALSNQSFAAGTLLNVVFGGDVVTGGGTASGSAPGGTLFYPGEAGWWQAHAYVQMTLASAGSLAIASLTLHDSGGIIRQSSQHFPVAAGFGEFYGTCSVTMEPVEVTDPANTYFSLQVTSVDEDGSGSGSAGTVWGFSTFGSGGRTRMGIFKVG